jgi:hypothetical protein
MAKKKCGNHFGTGNVLAPLLLLAGGLVTSLEINIDLPCSGSTIQVGAQFLVILLDTLADRQV